MDKLEKEFFKVLADYEYDPEMTDSFTETVILDAKAAAHLCKEKINKAFTAGVKSCDKNVRPEDKMEKDEWIKQEIFGGAIYSKFERK